MKRYSDTRRKVFHWMFGATIALFVTGLAPVLAAQTVPWTEIPQAQERSLSSSAERLILPQRYRTVRLDWTGLDSILRDAPMESSQAISSNAAVLSLPLADGSFGRFRVEESPIMDGAMAASLPNVKTYRGVGIDDPIALVRFDTTPAGFHAMIRSDNGTVFIDPYARGETDLYVVYNKRDFNVPASERPICRVGDPAYVTPHSGLPPMDFETVPGVQTNVLQNGATFKEVKLAVAATGEYTTFHGGSVSGAKTAIVTTINRVNMVFGHDLAIRFELVDNTAIVFTDANTDPYSNMCDDPELSINQATIDNAIGAGNYDLGHVMGGPGGGGGVANVGPCLYSEQLPSGGAGVANTHAFGCTGSDSPVGDPFDIDFVSHEIGHQFGAPHTFNSTASDCGLPGNRVANNAYEPGSGSTIMGYAGICGTDDLQQNSDAYFHGSSLETIAGYDPTTFGAAKCIDEVPSGNPLPSADAGVDRNIPKGTPFELCGTGTDDRNDVTFLWEEFDLGPDPGGAPNNPNSTPFFRSFSPTSNSCRTFPQLNDILTNTATIGEILPAVAWPMTFRLTVFDNDPGAFGGGFDQDEVKVTVDGNAGPFRITSPNAPVNWNGGEQQTVTWDIAKTSEAPVNCANVDLRFSTDGGQTFPTPLAIATANDGTALIVVPVGDTTTGRIKAQCSDNVFFDINDANITVGGGGCADDSFESNGDGNTDDTCYGANLGAIPAMQTHLHCDEDWVYFDAEAGKTYRIETSNPVGGADTVISVHESCGPPLATDDNSHPDGISSVLEFTANSTIAVDVRITEANDNYDTGKGYDISVSEVGGCPVTLNLANQMISGNSAFVAQNKITTGPAFEVTASGNLTLTAGAAVVFDNGTTVSGALTVNLTPNPCNGVPN